MTKTYIIESYYAENGIKMRKLVDRILYQMNVYTNDMDEYYSLANEVFVRVIEKYDESRDFESMFFVCFSNKVKNMLRDQNRAKRKAEGGYIDISEIEIGDYRSGEEYCLSEIMLVAADWTDDMKKFYRMIAQGFERKEVVNIMGIADWQYPVYKKKIRKMMRCFM